MKNNCIIIVGMLLCINSCRMPADPHGIDIIQHIGPISTVGKCLDIDVNDSLFVAATHSDGFIIFNLYDSSGNINPTQKYHGSNLDPNVADEQIN